MCSQNEPLQLYTTSEAAAILSVSLRTIHTWIESGVLTHIRLGPAKRMIRISAQDLAAFVKSGRSEPDTPLPPSPVCN